MSTLLNQAIVEAEALREAALKSAEAAVVDKYSSQIKEAVEQLLQQEEEDLFGDDVPLDDAEASDILDKVSTSAEEEDDALCLCPDEQEEEKRSAEPSHSDVIELDLDRLMESLKEGGDSESAAAEAATEEEVEDVESEEALEEELTLTEEEDISEVDIKETIKEIAESLVVETEPTREGWAGTPHKIMQHKAKQLLAMLQSDEHKEDFEAINNAVKKLQNENKQLEKIVEKKETRIEKLAEAITMMKEILEESNVVNARLLYKVKVLENNSLNERQKSQVAEKLSEAKSVEEAKLIFETLQSSVGSTKRHPESLSEAVERSSSAMLLSRKRETTPSDQAPALDRWKALAGLK
jgi:hypothetical protein